MTRGRSTVFDIVVRTGGVLLELINGDVLEFAAATEPGETPLFVKTSESEGIEITDAAAGAATLEISAEDTESFSAKTVLAWELVLVRDTRTYSLGFGKLTVRLGVVA